MLRQSAKGIEMALPIVGVDTCVRNGVAAMDHHAVAHIDPHVACAAGVVGALEEDQVAGF